VHHEWRNYRRLQKKEKIILSVCDMPAGLKSGLVQSIPHQGRIIISIVTMVEFGSYEKERKGPARLSQ